MNTKKMSEDAMTLYMREHFEDESAQQGVLIWKTRPPGAGRAKIGGRAGRARDNRRDIKIRGYMYKEHHLVWLWTHGRYPVNEIDHIDHDGRNNHPSNLREVSGKTNQQNRPIQKNNKSGCQGVHWNKRKQRWRVDIRKPEGGQHVRTFVNLDDAKEHAMETYKKFGYHANHYSES
tara:strand:- start:1048 stop:1575 length:528 start_codon:yes stop_codon:yes gene_type:complete